MRRDRLGRNVSESAHPIEPSDAVNRPQGEAAFVAREVWLNSIIDQHGMAVGRVLSALEHDRMNREELWADVFRVAYERAPEILGLTAAETRAWLSRAARYLAANSARRAQTQRKVSERVRFEHGRTTASAEDEWVAQDDAHDRSGRFHDAFASICVEHRRVLLLAAGGRNGLQIAEQLGISHQAARSRFMRARRSLVEACGMTEGSVEVGET